MPNEPMTEERLVEIRGREKAATQGPWRVKSKIIEADECGNVTFATTYVSTNDKAICFVYGRGHDDVNEREDAAFLAHAREDIPALLDEVERLRAENEQLKEAAWKVFQAGKKLVDIECEKEMKKVEEFALRYTMEHNKR